MDQLLARFVDIGCKGVAEDICAFVSFDVEIGQVDIIYLFSNSFSARLIQPRVSRFESMCAVRDEAVDEVHDILRESLGGLIHREIANHICQHYF